MRVPSVRTIRTSAVALATVGVTALSACAPPSAPAGPEIFSGGTYPVEIVVEPQEVTTDFTFLGSSCSATTTTPSVDVRGTLTVEPAELDPASASVILPGAELDLPSGTVSAGSISLTCNGSSLGSVGLQLRFDALATSTSVVLDTSASTLTMTDPSVSLRNARVTFTGAAAGLPEVPLGPVEVTVPSILIEL
jgi:hypothetical protein